MQQTSVLESKTRVLRNGHDSILLNISCILHQLLQSIQQDTSNLELHSDSHGGRIVADNKRAQVVYLIMEGCGGGFKVAVFGRAHRHPESVVEEDALDAAVNLGEMQEGSRSFGDCCPQSDEQEWLRLDLSDHFVLVSCKECPARNSVDM